MASTISNSSTTRCAVVTGANKGIGLEICRQLASNGITVVLTARDEKKGTEAVENLKLSGLPDVIFHQLDVTNIDSISSLAKFIENQFEKIDILVNNAGVGGAIVDWEAFTTFKVDDGEFDWRRLKKSNNVVSVILHKASKANLLKEFTKESYDLAEECVVTNYYGTKRVTEALLSFLLQSNSGRIVNVSASIGRLQFVSNESAKKELNDNDFLTKDRLDELVNGFLNDFKENLLEPKGWPTHLSAYIVSKAAVNAYTRIVAKEHPSLRVNCVCPGFVKTDINSHHGVLTVEDGARGPVMLALLPNGGLTGNFFDKLEASTF